MLVGTQLVFIFGSDTLLPVTEDDWDIQHSHSSVIFNAFLDPYLPESLAISGNSVVLNGSDWDTITSQQAVRADQRQKIVTHTEIPHFGTLDRFVADHREIALLKTVHGSHDIGKIEGVQDTIGRMFDLV